MKTLPVSDYCLPQLEAVLKSAQLYIGLPMNWDGYIAFISKDDPITQNFKVLLRHPNQDGFLLESAQIDQRGFVQTADVSFYRDTERRVKSSRLRTLLIQSFQTLSQCSVSGNDLQALYEAADDLLKTHLMDAVHKIGSLPESIQRLLPDEVIIICLDWTNLFGE